MENMRKEFIYNNTMYVLTCKVDRYHEQIRVEVRIPAEKIPSKSLIYDSSVKDNRLLNFLGLTTKKRLEMKIKKAIKKIKKNRSEKNSLEDAIEYADEIFNLDKKMNL